MEVSTLWVNDVIIRGTTEETVSFTCLYEACRVELKFLVIENKNTSQEDLT